MELVKKADIVREVAQATGFRQKDIADVLGALKSVVWESLRDHKEVCLLEGIKLNVKFKDAHEARNPGNGEMVSVPAKYIPKAKFGGSIKTFINE